MSSHNTKFIPPAMAGKWIVDYSSIMSDTFGDVEFVQGRILSARQDNGRAIAHTRIKTCLFVALLFSCLLPSIGCQSEKSSTTTDTLTRQQLETVERIGSEASQTLEENLGKQLKAALQSGGSEKALHVCKQLAQPLTVQTSHSFSKASVTRTALRFRNEANAPNEEDRAILSEWETLLANGTELPPSKLIGKLPNQAIYYKPILTKPICLTCHGDPSTFSPELTESLNRSYPKDTATNFAEGDLRGAFRVVVELD